MADRIKVPRRESVERAGSLYAAFRCGRIKVFTRHTDKEIMTLAAETSLHLVDSANSLRVCGRGSTDQSGLLTTEV